MVNQPVPYGVNAAGSSNKNGIIFAEASRSDSADPDGLGAGIYVSKEIVNDFARGVDVHVNTTTSGSGTLVVKLQKKDPATDTWADLPGAVTATLNDPADVILTVYPGIAETANVSVSDHLCHSWRVHATVATAAVTFAVGAVYLV